MSLQPSRRDILAAAASVAIPAVLPLGRTYASPNDKINLGVIGFGPRCNYDLTAMLKSEQIRCVAMSETQASRGEKGKQLVDEAYGNQDCKIHRDFRDLLAREDIDAVLIATGDRWHADASILAAEAGKDVYSEKPCGITIEKCQQLADTIDRTGRVFQAGTQRRSVPNFVRAVEMARLGALGEIRTLHASVYRPTLDNGWLPAEKTPDPKQCDWNMWLGPAAWRPFNQRYVNGRWRGIWDFDSGARLLDWGAHTVDLCQWANDADDTMPIRYEPHDDKIVCGYENGVKLVIDFLDDPFGDRSPHYTTRLGTCPVRFIGDKGSVETGDSGEIVVTPESIHRELPEDGKRVRGLDVSAHAENFFDCIRSRQAPAASQTVMRRSHIASHAAAIAWIIGRTVTIDPQTETFIDENGNPDKQANLLRSRPSRDWTA